MLMPILTRQAVLGSAMMLMMVAHADTATPIDADITTIDDAKQDGVYDVILFNQAILNKDVPAILAYLPIYQSRPDADPITIAHARAVIAQKQGDIKTAIAIYRDMIGANPSLTPIRFELAQLLYEDKQNIAAKDQLHKVLADSPPPFVAELSTAYLEALTKRASWDIDMNINYIQDSNINNGTNIHQIEDTAFVRDDSVKPRTAHGISYAFGAQKDWNIKDNHYLSFENQLNGKYYHRNDEYNDIINRTSIGYRYQDGNITADIKPFFERRWYANEGYQKSTGLSLSHQKWLSAHSRLSTSAELANNRYDDNEELKGRHYQLSGTLFYMPKAKYYFYAGADWLKDNTQARHMSSVRYGVRAGVGYEWQYGISSRLGLSVAKRNFADTAIIGGFIPVDTVRKDKEYGINLALWKRDWHWFGVTPKLTYTYKKTDSNLASVYSSDKSQTYISFEKVF